MKLNIRIDFDDERALGPGKIRLLELIGERGSISAAGREMGMAYTRAWQLVEALNNVFDAPLVQVQHGGERGGGAKGIERLARPAMARPPSRKRR